MQIILSEMQSNFEKSKSAGSYGILLFLAILVLYSLKKEKNKWLADYTLLVILLVVANPVFVFLAENIFPVLAFGVRFYVLLPTAILVPYATVLLLDRVSSRNQKIIISICIALIIGLAGTGYGTIEGTQRLAEKSYFAGEEAEILKIVSAGDNEVLLLAPNQIMEMARDYDPQVRLLYGKDLWIEGLDLGIQDNYSKEIIDAYTAMQSQDVDQIAVTASKYQCDFIVLNNMEGQEPAISGYQILSQTQNYQIYEKK